MTNPVINRLFPIFRVAVIVVLAVTGRLLKYGFGLLAILIMVIALLALLAALNGTLTLREGGTYLGSSLKLSATFAVFCIVSWLGEKIIQFNERLARSTAEYMGEDLDKI